MKFILFEQLACLAHIKHNTQPSKFWVKLSILVTYFQYAALILPMNGWNLWKYQDGHLKLFQILVHSQLIIPLLASSSIDFSTLALTLSIILLIILCTIIVAFFILGIYNNQNPEDHYSIRNFVFYFVLVTSTVYQLPLIFLFISQILIGQQTLNFQSFAFGFQSIINFFALLLFGIMVIFSQYFLRAYTLVPFNTFQQRFNGFQILHFFLNNILAIFSFLDYDQTIQYAQLALIHIQLIFKLIECYLTKPYVPFMNQTHFNISFTVECINIIVSINVFTNNDLISEGQLLFSLLFAGSAGYFISDVFYQSKAVSTFEYEVASHNCISYAQEMYFRYSNLCRFSQQIDFFQLFFFWKAHKTICQKSQKKQIKRTDLNCIQLTHQTIFCMLQTELEKSKIDTKLMYEELQLLFISYMAEQAQKPLLAFVELKKYQILKTQQSYYFSIIQIQMSKYIQQLILTKQSQILGQKVQQQQQLDQERQLSILSILETLSFQDELLPKFHQLLNEKIAFWTNQIKGFSNIYDLEKLAITQSTNILSLIKKLQHFFNFDVFHLNDHISFQTNVLNIKLISIFYSTIMNDYYGTQICESAIVEIFNQEHTYSEDIVTNLTLVQEKAAMIMLSMVKNRGKIVNQDKRLLAKYFSFEEQEFGQIESISSLMPSFFSERHDKLLQDYLQSAKSIFFDDYKMIFSLSKERMLIPQQLKIDNNFSLLDDYVLIGCLSEIKHSSDFVLFGDDGYLIGCTRNFYETVFQFTNQTNQTKFFSPEYIGQINIYMVFPNIFELLNDIKNKLKNEIQFGVQDKYCKIYKFSNLKETLDDDFNLQQTIKLLQNDTFERSQSVQKSKTSATTLELNKTLKLQLLNQPFGEIYESSSVKQKTIQYLLQLPIYHLIFQSKAAENMKKIEGREKIEYICKVDLHFKTIGIKKSKKAFFILEINDIRRNYSENKTNESLQNNPYSLSINYTNQNLLNSSQTMRQESDTGLESIPVANEGITPNILKVNEISAITLKKKSKQQQVYDAQLYGMESGRESISYCPISQRINFISPSSKQQQLQGLIDQDFTELQVQLEYDGGDDLINDAEIPEPSQVKGISNSNEKQERSNNLLQLIQINQLHKQQDELEVSAKKSRSSNTSGTSGMSAIQVIKKFQQKTDLTVTLQILLAVNITTLLTVIIYLAIHLINIKSYNDSILETLNNITGPLLFNRYFCKTITYIWSLVFNSLGIIDSSDYILIQTLEQITSIAETMLASLRGMYSTFVGIEVSGLMSAISLDFLYQDNENVTYTYFINLIQSVTDALFQAQYYTIYNLDQLITTNYLDNMLTLRYNLKNVVKMNTELLDSLNVIFTNLQQSILTEFQIQIAIEIIILSLIMLLQICYWNQLEKYCQQLILLVGRLQESQAQELIIRFTYISETLANITGKQSWKQQNFYKLTYIPLNQLGIESLKTESRILKDYQFLIGMKSKQQLNPIVEENQKKYRKNQNVSLNSRIGNNNTTILKASILVIFAFLIYLAYFLGGYLLYNSQSVDLSPTQQLTLNFIRFTSYQDITVSTALITKSQPLLYNKLIEENYYTAEQMENFNRGNKMIQIFVSYHNTYFENLSNIYQYIIESNSINGDDESVLLNLYQNNFCILLSEEIPFCNLNSNFAEEHGNYSSSDDNREYLSTGIQGVVSRMDAVFKQSFQYEIANTDFQSDTNLSLTQINSKEFNNAIFQHFLDTTYGTNMFIDNLIRILQSLMINNLTLMQTYYLSAGILLFAIYFVVFGIWMLQANQRLIKLRLILTNLPIEILTEPHTLTLLKRLK